jgi:trimeric autotransporter adhesin
MPAPPGLSPFTFPAAFPFPVPPPPHSAAIQVTVTTAGNDPTKGSSLKVLVLTGATEAGGNQATRNATGAPSWSLTPAGPNSLPCFAIFDRTGGTTGEYAAAASNTLLDNALAHDAFCDGYYSGVTTAGTPVTVGCSAPSGTNVQLGAAYEVLASGGTTPVIDASTPAVKNGLTVSQTTDPFIPPPGSVLVALVTGNNPSADPTVTDTAGLTWTKRSSSLAAGSGEAGVFTATVPGSPSGANAGTASLAGQGSLSATVVQDAGTLTALTGAGTLTAPAAQGAPASLTGTGTLTAIAVQQATASLTGTGSLTAVTAQAAVAATAGTGTLAAVVTQQAVAVLASAGSLAANSAGATSGTASLAGTGSLTAAARTAAAAVLAGVSTVTAPARISVPAALSATGILAAAGGIPVPFTIGTLTAADKAAGVLTAAGASSALTAATAAAATLTATDQRTGGPG